MSKPTVGIFGLTGCAGDQLAVLNCEDELLGLVELLDIRDFLMASSQRDTGSLLDIALVEGAVLSRRDEDTLREIRQRARTLIALGTCAVWGGVPALDRGQDRDALLAAVYGRELPDYDALPARALHEVVPVDYAITGCPIEKSEFLAAIADLLNGNPPQAPDYPVCTECRIRENRCMIRHEKRLCCGPVTAAGCDARCPSLGVPCVGCRGPAVDANMASALELFVAEGFDPAQVARRLGTFAPFSLS
jgi:sulfhydrogenase subunit delta